MVLAPLVTCDKQNKINAILNCVNVSDDTSLYICTGNVTDMVV